MNFFEPKDGDFQSLTEKLINQSQLNEKLRQQNANKHTLEQSSDLVRDNLQAQWQEIKNENTRPASNASHSATLNNAGHSAALNSAQTSVSAAMQSGSLEQSFQHVQPYSLQQGQSPRSSQATQPFTSNSNSNANSNSFSGQSTPVSPFNSNASTGYSGQSLATGSNHQAFPYGQAGSAIPQAQTPINQNPLNAPQNQYQPMGQNMGQTMAQTFGQSMGQTSAPNQASSTKRTSTKKRSSNTNQNAPVPPVQPTGKKRNFAQVWGAFVFSNVLSVIIYNFLEQIFEVPLPAGTILGFFLVIFALVYFLFGLRNK